VLEICAFRTVHVINSNSGLLCVVVKNNTH